MEANRFYRIGEEVYFYATFENGLPSLQKGHVVGVRKGNGIYSFIYSIESFNGVYSRFPDAIYKSVKEAADDVPNLLTI